MWLVCVCMCARVYTCVYMCVSVSLCVCVRMHVRTYVYENGDFFVTYSALACYVVIAYDRSGGFPSHCIIESCLNDNTFRHLSKIGTNVNVVAISVHLPTLDRSY